MKTLGRLCALGLALALAPRPAGAVSISLSPASITPSGSSFSIDLIVAGLGAAGAPSLGAFARRLRWRPGGRP